MIKGLYISMWIGFSNRERSKMVSPLFLAYILTGTFFINDDVSRWLDYKTNYNLEFSDVDEERSRFNIFIDNVRSIEEHNMLYEMGDVTWTQTINEYTHLSPDEFSEKITGSLMLDNVDDQDCVNLIVNDSIPLSIDWTSRNKVTPVKNQGRCGSCWAFSAVGAVESQYAIRHNALVEFSEQNLLDCAGSAYNCKGCSGGVPYKALQYIRDVGIALEQNYPYRGQKTVCQHRGNFKIRSVCMLSKNEKVMRNTVGSFGPVSATLNANLLQFYHSGIFYSNVCSQRPNHGILITGYGSQGNVPYWKIKNSWGRKWGEQGYFRMIMGRNMCGINSYVSYPILY